MAAMIQTYPPQPSTATMLQTRPASATAMMPANQNRQAAQYGHTSRASSYSNLQPGYRATSGPAQPRTFNQLNHNMQWQQYPAYRTNSPSAAPLINSLDQNAHYRGQMNANAANNLNFTPANNVTRDDSALRNFGPQQSPYYNPKAHGKNVPDRYRRANAQSVQHNRSQSTTLPAGSAMYQIQNGSLSVPNLTRGLARSRQSSSAEDLYNRAVHEEAMKHRRRSIHSSDAFRHSLGPLPVIQSSSTPRPPSANRSSSSGRHSLDKSANSNALVPAATSVHSRSASAESVSSRRSASPRPSSANRTTSAPSNSASVPGDNATSKTDQPKQLTSARATSAETARRTHSPSPLSKPATMASEPDARPATSSGSPGSKLDSPAAKHLAALNQKGTKAKSKTSRLRRAFSFGSASELRKVSEEETLDPASPTKLHKEPSVDEAYDAQQARIAEAQEAGGLGNSIYGSRFFGSTDNLSISSTASSASVMIRKMGRGMKKSTRSLVGLFRPKSLVGVPSAEAAVPEVSHATVSMITAEAEAQRVNVTADPSASNGVTGFPHLERNSMDAGHVPDMAHDRPASLANGLSDTRGTMPGGDKEQAEVLAAVRKGILKRPGSSSPSTKPDDLTSPELILPAVPAIGDSPNSSAPSTPNDEAQGHRRTGSIALGNEDYFMTALRMRSDSKSAPVTPSGGKRCATFSPRIIFHDTWPPQEYDRRGDIATCNRLTPMLAQQIKEELNTFKMEMEVHENSKIYTHFF